MFRNLRFVAGLVLGMMASGGLAQPRQVITTVHQFDPPSASPPTSVLWQLATATGEHVDLAFSGIAPVISGQIQYVMTPDAPLGVDFQAWRAAASDPAYTRSIMSFGAVTHEQPFENPFDDFELDRITLFILEYRSTFLGGPPLPVTVYVQGSLTDFLPVPEPASSLLFIMAMIAVPRSTRYGSWN
jgi:hypothetical protein